MDINGLIPDHTWMSLRALDFGKHMMCTVPVPTTIHECRQIVDKVWRDGSRIHDGRDGRRQTRPLIQKSIAKRPRRFAFSLGTRDDLCDSESLVIRGRTPSSEQFGFVGAYALTKPHYEMAKSFRCLRLC